MDMVRQRTALVVLVLSAFFLCLLCMPSPSRSQECFTTFWKVGDRWTVKAVYRVEGKADGWSKPVYWEYEIRGLNTSGDDECFELSITPRSGQIVKTGVRMLIRCRDLTPAVVEIPKNRRGKEYTTVIRYGGSAPVETEQTLAPYDMPVFPLCSSSSSAFRFMRSIGEGLQQVKKIRQDVQVRSEHAVDGEKIVCDERLFEVTCFDSNKNIMFQQYWCAGSKWPLYGWNRDMRYWLVEK